MESFVEIFLGEACPGDGGTGRVRCWLTTLVAKARHWFR